MGCLIAMWRHTPAFFKNIDRPGRTVSCLSVPPANLFKPGCAIEGCGESNSGNKTVVGVNIMAQCIKKSGIRDAAQGVNVGSEVYDEVDRRVQEMVEQAVQRAQSNGRKTVKARDV
ncbi:MAG: hypothetical protein ABEK12_03425 [Candidatus Nanohaloarchaea archaeon]